MFVLDESSYRIDKTNFPTREEAEQKAGEAARILGRAISVYTLINGELLLSFKVNPDGTVSYDDATHDPMKEETVDQPTTPILGDVDVGDLGKMIKDDISGEEMFDEVAEIMEKAGRPDLAAVVDSETRRISSDANPIGKPQSTIMDYLRKNPKVALTDLAKGSPFRGMHFKQIMKSAEELARKGLIGFDGTTLELKASRQVQAKVIHVQVVDMINNKLLIDWRTEGMQSHGPGSAKSLYKKALDKWGKRYPDAIVQIIDLDSGKILKDNEHDQANGSVQRNLGPEAIAKKLKTSQRTTKR